MGSQSLPPRFNHMLQKGMDAGVSKINELLTSSSLPSLPTNQINERIAKAIHAITVYQKASGDALSEIEILNLAIFLTNVEKITGEIMAAWLSGYRTEGEGEGVVGDLKSVFNNLQSVISRHENELKKVIETLTVICKDFESIAKTFSGVTPTSATLIAMPEKVSAASSSKVPSFNFDDLISNTRTIMPPAKKQNTGKGIVSASTNLNKVAASVVGKIGDDTVMETDSLEIDIGMRLKSLCLREGPLKREFAEISWEDIQKLIMKVPTQVFVAKNPAMLRSVKEDLLSNLRSGKKSA